MNIHVPDITTGPTAKRSVGAPCMGLVTQVQGRANVIPAIEGRGVRKNAQKGDMGTVAVRSVSAVRIQPAIT